MYILYVLQIMASHMKCGSCGFKSDDSSRRIRAWRGGGGSGWHILKYPARLMLKYVCILKSCGSICVQNVLKLNIRALSIIIIMEGLSGLIDLFSLVYAHCTSYLSPCTESILIVSHKYPLYLMYNNRTVSIY